MPPKRVLSAVFVRFLDGHFDVLIGFCCVLITCSLMLLFVVFLVCMYVHMYDLEGVGFFFFFFGGSFYKLFKFVVVSVSFLCLVQHR